MADEKTFWVKGVKGLNEPREGEHRVLLFEQDTAHPNGEAFIAGPLPVEVGDTAEVQRLLKDGSIEKTSKPADTAKPDPRDARIAELEAQLAAAQAPKK